MYGLLESDHPTLDKFALAGVSILSDEDTGQLYAIKIELPTKTGFASAIWDIPPGVQLNQSAFTLRQRERIDAQLKDLSKVSDAQREIAELRAKLATATKDSFIQDLRALLWRIDPNKTIQLTTEILRMLNSLWRS